MLDPASAYLWSDLGEQKANNGRTEEARYCFERALKAGPRNPVILIRAGNFYFSSGDKVEAKRCFSAVLRDPWLAGYYPVARHLIEAVDRTDSGDPGEGHGVRGNVHIKVDQTVQKHRDERSGAGDY